MSCKTPGCLDVMTCQCEQRQAVADAETSTVAAIVKVMRDAVAIDERHPFFHDTICMADRDITELADWIESLAWKRPGEGGQKP